MSERTVCVDVATVWTSPEAPRAIDAPAVADLPDVAAWIRSLDDAGRLGLHGRTLTQLVRDEPVVVVGDGPPGWLQVVAPWQPAPADSRGYPGWARAAHVTEHREPAGAGRSPAPIIAT